MRRWQPTAFSRLGEKLGSGRLGPAQRVPYPLPPPRRTARRRRTQAADAGAFGHLQPAQHAAVVGVDAAQLAFVASQVPCHSSPSTQVTPVTKRFDSMLRMTRPSTGSIWWIRRSRYWPTHRLPRPRPGPNRCPARCRIDASTAGGVDLVDARLGDLVQVLAVEPSSVARRAASCAAAPLAGSKATSAVPRAAQTRRPSWLTPCTRPSPPKGPYSRTISAGCTAAAGVGCRSSSRSLSLRRDTDAVRAL